MKKVNLLLILFFSLLNAIAQPVYIKTFGKKEAPAVIFLHGGPGYNAANFESTTAQNLADKGFFVIVYDRRGEGRSEDKNAKFAFQECFDDINTIYKDYAIDQAILIGHGFGGILATLYTEKYPAKVNFIVLVSTPVSVQESFRSIISACKSIYTAGMDSVQLKLIKDVEKMDTTSLSYSSACFNHAMVNKLYSIANPSEEAKNIYAKFRSDSANIKYVYQFSYEAPQGFLNNEKYTSINISTNLKKIKDAKKKVFAFYGKDDGTNSGSAVDKMKSIIGAANVIYADVCSYNGFIDQQAKFIEAFETWGK